MLDETTEKPDRRRLCEEILRDGFVQSYVDFFYLTHRPDPTVDAGEADAEREIEVPPEEMLYIRENLTQVRRAPRSPTAPLAPAAHLSPRNRRATRDAR